MHNFISNGVVCVLDIRTAMFGRTLFHCIFFIFIYFAINIYSAKKTTPVSVHLWSCEDAKGLRPSVAHFKWLLLDENHFLSCLTCVNLNINSYVCVVVFTRYSSIIALAKVELCTFTFRQFQCLIDVHIETSHKKATDCFCSDISVRFTFLACFFFPVSYFTTFPQLFLLLFIFLLLSMFPSFFFCYCCWRFFSIFGSFELTLLSVLIIFAIAVVAQFFGN